MVIAANNDGFTSKPKDKEVFVGESIQFDWDYIKNDTDEVRFGVKVNTTEVTICKFVLKDRTTIFNNRNIEIKNYIHRVEVVSDRRASFRIKNVQMSDRGTYFCSLVNTDELDHIISSVKMTVVGKYSVYLCARGNYEFCYGQLAFDGGDVTPGFWVFLV